ncbi:hypothetical protein [Parafilimonas sp.]|uniref:hypothetical protein n=1 Tax=Parafilimonas sp. TaxID=1969739 RepID=UPI0039E6748A
MTYNEFLLTIKNAEVPPSALPLYIEALWWDARGNWDKAHALIDSLDDKNSCRVHAYLHRKEGDIWNADYWYRRAHAQRPAVSLDEEWENLAANFLQ